MRIGMGTKVIILFLIAGLVPLAIMGILSNNSSSKALKQQSFNQLVSVRETKKKQIEDYFSTIRKQVQTFSEDRMIVDATKYFKDAFSEFRTENDISDSQIDEYKSALKNYYTGDFENEYKQLNNGKQSNVVRYLNQLDDNSIALQYHLIAANPNKLGEKHQLDTVDIADGKSSYNKAHTVYHPVIREYLEQFGYYDIFIVDPDSGNIVYSVFKELDFATSLKNGPYADTNFARVFNEANNSNEPDFVKLVDFEPYAPSYENAASFIASPIYNGTKKIGILIFQMPIDKINAVMTSDSDWKNVGLGSSGETYLIGRDLAMRSQSRFLIEDRDGYYTLMKRLGTDQDVLDKINAKDSTIMLQKVDTKGTRAAIAGNTHIEIFPDYRNVSVLSAYAPVDIEDVDWAIMSEIDEDEALQAVASLRASMWKLAGGMLVLIVGIGYLVTRITGNVTTVIKNMIDSLTDCSSQIASASGQVSSSSQSLAEGSSEQASSLEETSASMEEMAAVTKQNADNAEEAAKLVDMCSVSAENGNSTVEEMNTAMGEINTGSKKIAEITKVIDGIAFQTNLLALNAAVEAARAGEHGKGFAVVAEEVRNLAQRSAAAAKDTTALIDESVTKADNGAKLAVKCGDALQDIVRNVKKATDLTKEIKNASVEQSEGISQVNNAIHQMDQVTQENAANAEETASASEEMTAQTENLMDQIDTLAALVGSTGNVASSTGEKESRGRISSQGVPRVNKAERVRKVKTDGNGHNATQSRDLEAVIPMGTNRIVEHDDSYKDF
ncbi:methyl-accepting chemotaxis sensory transducer [Candidatus Scalindua japonica]|uniref:Methyl-accepting chemotaxis sensory transducer n=1 Tax=Candidatus Scalindua japonica TaxID=1284222 RepID=A0A286U1U4_9BACT|nr:methyl-accepting chemotaxis protein [Candidatus Scalindua japonica]GAX62120.1 methyl-accepting chemotaxis sensory transducer [Candidatus Scalindua japonica]